MLELWEILVPCKFGDNDKPIRTKHHKEWDKYVRKLTGGLTILKPAKGIWVHENELYEERMIPVRIACSKEIIDKIMDFSALHYRQKAIMCYKISQETIIKEY